MKKFFIILLLIFSFTQNVNAHNIFSSNSNTQNIRQIKSLLNNQVKAANNNDFDKFISVYDAKYSNFDGANLETYSKQVKELWETYNKIKYSIKIQDIVVTNDNAEVILVEHSYADLPISSKMNGILKSKSNSIYYLKKLDNKWKIISDKVIDEDTSMLYGDALSLDIKLEAPFEVKPDTEYTASLEFIPPPNTFAIASIAKDKIEYPQKQAKEVFRKMPEDNILERLFIANNDNYNEYIVASIGLTKADIKDLSIKLSLTGFGYKIIRVNVLPYDEGNNDKNK